MFTTILNIAKVYLILYFIVYNCVNLKVEKHLNQTILQLVHLMLIVTAAMTVVILKGGVIHVVLNIHDVND